jgi:DtxR family Mn-dependent transcriptional regulator
MNSALVWTIAALALATVAAAVAWPRRGLLARWGAWRAARQRMLAEDALKHLHTCEWRGQVATPDSLAGGLRLSPRAAFRLITRLEAQGWLRSMPEGLRLTPDGERLALQVIRAHRLWERYLADEARMPLADVHAEAERREHGRTAEGLLALDAALGYPNIDPHGDPIPTAAGRLDHVAAQPITAWPLGSPALIVHLEDEPAAIFAQVAAQGLRPGQTVRLIEAGAQRIVLSDGEQTFSLAPVVAAMIYVVPAHPKQPGATARRLTELRPGQRATVQDLDAGLQGFTRRRLLDLGLTPGATVEAELQSLFRDPVAYRVRGTLVALRRDQARQVLVH